jgi:hypothetical protein
VALVALLLSAGLVACGGGDGSDSSTAETGAQTQGEATPGGGASQQNDARGDEQGEAGEEEKSNVPDVSNFTPKQHSDSGGGSQQFKVKGGDNSIQEFGEEAGASERDAAAIVVHDFLDARAEGNWPAACAYISKGVLESLEKFAGQTKQAENASCAGVLEKLTNPAAKEAMKAEAEKADVGSLRIKDEQAFVIYTGVGGTVLAIPMANEGGTWKVAGLAGSPLG